MSREPKNPEIPNRYSLLVDACIASALSDPAIGKLVNALIVVNELQRGPVVLAMTTELRKEWLNHSSRYMLRFLARMESKRRVSNYTHKRVADFRVAIKKHVHDTGNRRAIEKDAHLTEVAIRYGIAIMSLDEKQRKLLQTLAEKYNTLSSIQWFNPTDEDDSCHRWLREAPHDRSIGTLVR